MKRTLSCAVYTWRTEKNFYRALRAMAHDKAELGQMAHQTSPAHHHSHRCAYINIPGSPHTPIPSPGLPSRAARPLSLISVPPLLTPLFPTMLVSPFILSLPGASGSLPQPSLPTSHQRQIRRGGRRIRWCYPLDASYSPHRGGPTSSFTRSSRRRPLPLSLPVGALASGIWLCRREIWRGMCDALLHGSGMDGSLLEFDVPMRRARRGGAARGRGGFRSGGAPTSSPQWRGGRRGGDSLPQAWRLHIRRGPHAPTVWWWSRRADSCPPHHPRCRPCAPPSHPWQGRIRGRGGGPSAGSGAVVARWRWASDYCIFFFRFVLFVVHLQATRTAKPFAAVSSRHASCACFLSCVVHDTRKNTLIVHA
jgi:hypothetical protein